MRFGFRLYEIELRRGMGRKSVPWDAADGDYAEHLTGLLKVLTQGELPPLLKASLTWAYLDGLTEIRPAAEVKDDDKCVRFLTAQRVGPQHIHIETRYGVGGRFSHAMGPDTDTSIEDQAAGRAYRAEVLLPSDPTDTGLLAVESISRTTPVQSIVYWLAAASKVAPGDEWWRLRAEQVTDGDFLDELIDHTKDGEIVLKHLGRDGTGNQVASNYSLRSGMQFAKKGDVKAWARAKDRTHEGLLRIIGVENPGDLAFDDGYISIGDGDTTTRITVSDARETFTYPVSATFPSRPSWDEGVRARVHKLRPQLRW